MAAPTITYTLTNGTTADATKVMQNFNDLLNGITDGTKDLTINALTVAGALTANGDVALGNFSTDTITVSGSLGSSIPISTNNSYDIGSATLGLAGVYLGSGSGKSTRLVSTVTGTSYTLSLPAAVSTTSGQGIFTTNGSGGTEFRFSDKVTASKTTTYTATESETVIPCDASSAAFTVTLPAASGLSGKRYVIKKTDADTTKAVTVDGNASETIDGATTVALTQQYQTAEIISDGTGWHSVGPTSIFMPGMVSPYAGSTAPAGWLACDGSAVSRTTYRGLFEAISTTWGVGDGSTTFNVPDFRGRALIGSGTGSGLTARTLGTQNIGEEAHVQTSSELVSHTHTATTSTDGAHTHTSGTDYFVTQTGGAGIISGGGAFGAQSATASNGSHNHSLTTSSAGSSSAANVMQPSAVINWLIKT